MGHRSAILVLAACIGCSRGPGAGAAEVKPRPCSLEGIPGEVVCAAYPVRENRDRQAGRRIPLNIAMLPALSASRPISSRPSSGTAICAPTVSSSSSTSAAPAVPIP